MSTSPTETFDFGDLLGVADAALGPVREEELRRVCDPGSATESIHWGRNYLYVVTWRGAATSLPVVVKQFRNAGLRARLRRRLRGTKARRAWLAARAVAAAGVATPRPVLYADSAAADGPAYFLCEHLPGRLEVRYLLRSLEAGSVERDYPDLDVAAVFRAWGHLVRRLHEGRVWHRDLTCGNLLVDEGSFATGAVREAGSVEGLWLLDLNRARLGRRPTLSERMRDLCRLEVPAASMDAVWEGYWRPADSALTRRVGQALRGLYARAFLLRNRSKRQVRGLSRRLADVFLPRRRPHAHIPASAESAVREKIVWDPLSDQPHQHASKWEKARVRVVDAPEHAAFLAAAGRAWPSIRRRHRELEAHRLAAPASMDGFGVCVRPWPDRPEAVVEAVRDLGVRHVLLRLHPWQEDHGPELELARALADLDVELAFSLPQDRGLVRDPERWRRSVAELARLFAPLGGSFQVGQAVNRSKWGVWKPSEYARLFRSAAEELRAVRDDVLLFGPAVIDFEFHQTAGYLHRRFGGERLAFDGLASLLYVDRRGEPEAEQMGLDTVGKTALLRAIAESAPLAAGAAPLRNWVTEVNWPLREGPHSPAGRDVAVDEETQARYLARYFVAALAAGHVERVYWWQVIAKGYGLVDWHEDGEAGLRLRRRPSFGALATIVRELREATFTGRVGTAGEGQWLLRFRRGGGPSPDGDLVVGWQVGEGSSAVDLPAEVEAICGLGGEWSEHEGGRRVRLDGAPRIFRLRVD